MEQAYHSVWLDQVVGGRPKKLELDRLYKNRGTTSFWENLAWRFRPWSKPIRYFISDDLYSHLRKEPKLPQQGDGPAV
jgi:hypothetical protein